MKFLCGLAGVVLCAAACTSPNPRSCIDGICSDQQYPFCDVDGHFAGSPLTCIHVDCSPGDSVGCVADDGASVGNADKLTCNATGNNYEPTACPHDCDDATATCITPPPLACQTSSECANPNPVCATDHMCHPCQLDDQCASTVCDVTNGGTCLPENQVIFASPTGSASGNCSLQTPCTISRAISVATAATTTPLLKLMPGDYPVPFEVTSSVTLNVLATGARLIGNSWVKVSAGTVDIRGIEIAPSQTSHPALEVGAASGMLMPTLALHGAAIKGATRVYSGTLKVEQSSFVDLVADALVDVSGDVSGGTSTATFYADRTLFAGPSSIAENGQISTIGNHIDIRVTNSLLLDTTIRVATTQTGDKFNVGFNTFIFTNTQNPSGIVCGVNGYAQAGLFENNIIVNTPGNNAASGTKCTFSHNVLFPQSPPLAGNTSADPQFVNASAGDYHLMSTSPARDTAVPSAMLTVDHDYDGTTRPQGSAPDIGAFEYH